MVSRLAAGPPHELKVLAEAAMVEDEEVAGVVEPGEPQEPLSGRKEGVQGADEDLRLHRGQLPVVGQVTYVDPLVVEDISEDLVMLEVKEAWS